MTELWSVPAGWRWATMGEVARVVGGSTPKTSEPSYWGGDIPWITPDDLSGFTGKYIERGRRSITKAGYDSCSTQMVPAGTVLFTSRAPIGYVAIARNPVCTNQGFKSFIVGQEVDAEYAYWYLRATTDLARSMGSGTTFRELSGKAAARLPIPLPPLEHQRQVVRAVERHFARIDNAVDATADSVTALEAYGRALLMAGVTGRLDTPLAAPQSQQAAEEQDQSDGRLPHGWTWATWGELGTSQNGRAFPSKEYTHAGVRLLRPGNLHGSGRVRWTAKNTRYLPSDWCTKASAFLVGPGELVMNLTAQSLRDDFLGRVCLTGPDDVALLNQRLARLTPNAISSRYLLWVFKSPLFRRFVKSLNKGSLIQHMFTSQLDEFLVPVPPSLYQEKIADELDRRMSVVQHLEQAVLDSRSRARALRRAVLDWAFAGKLNAEAPQ